MWGASYAQGGYSPNHELGERFFFYLAHDGKWANSPPQKQARYLLSWVHPGERGRQILIRGGLPLLLPLLLSLSLQLFHHLDPGQEKASLEAEARCDAWAAGRSRERRQEEEGDPSLTQTNFCLPSFPLLLPNSRTNISSKVGKKEGRRKCMDLPYKATKKRGTGIWIKFDALPKVQFPAMHITDKRRKGRNGNSLSSHGRQGQLPFSSSSPFFPFSFLEVASSVVRRLWAKKGKGRNPMKI